MTTDWFVIVGYTLELAPLLLKLQAINKVAREGMQIHRIEIDRKVLTCSVFIFIAPVLLFLVLWTSIATPKITYSFLINDSDNASIVADQYCKSGSQLWDLVGYIWQALLLFSASILAFQSRDMDVELNESHWIGFLLYNHFMFLIFRIVIQQVSLIGVIPGSLGWSLVSILLSLDILISMMMYFGPKFYNIATDGKKKLGKSGLAAGSSGKNKTPAPGSRSEDLSRLAQLRKAGVKTIMSSQTSEICTASSTQKLVSFSDEK